MVKYGGMEVTKIEIKRCEKLLDEAIRNAIYSKENYSAYERLLKDGNKVDAECKLRTADQEYGYADGIRQALVSIGFTHERMAELDELL